jgi:hypothetical protein
MNRKWQAVVVEPNCMVSVYAENGECEYLSKTECTATATGSGCKYGNGTICCEETSDDEVV